MTFWKEKKSANIVLKIEEMFVIFENSNVDIVAAWFDQPDIGRPKSRLTANSPLQGHHFFLFEKPLSAS